MWYRKLVFFVLFDWLCKCVYMSVQFALAHFSVCMFTSINYSFFFHLLWFSFIHFFSSRFRSCQNLFQDETRKKAASTYLVENSDIPPPRYQKDGTLPMNYPNNTANSGMSINSIVYSAPNPTLSNMPASSPTHCACQDTFYFAWKNFFVLFLCWVNGKGKKITSELSVVASVEKYHTTILPEKNSLVFIDCAFLVHVWNSIVYKCTLVQVW